MTRVMGRFTGSLPKILITRSGQALACPFFLCYNARMDKLAKVAIGIPAYGPQSLAFSLSLADFQARARKYGIELIGENGTAIPFSRVTMATDRNRNGIVRAMLKTDFEWSYWWDTDNTNPANSIAMFLRNATEEKKIWCGVYCAKNKKGGPIAYYQTWDGRYAQLDYWNRGEILKLDMTGMNGVLVHREVYEKIDREFVALQRVGVKDGVVHHGGGVVAVHKDDIVGPIDDNAIHPDDGKIINGVWHERMIYPQAPTDVPFFALEFNRTEDAWFYEMVRRCGYDIWCDTAVVSGHLKEMRQDPDGYWRRIRMRADGVLTKYDVEDDENE
jgi:hypothetical protein